MLEKQTQSSALANPSWHRGCDTLFTEMILVEDPKNTEKKQNVLLLKFIAECQRFRTDS